MSLNGAGRTSDADFISAHIRHTVDRLLERPRVIGDAVGQGQATVVGLRYRLADGTARQVAARGLDDPAFPPREGTSARLPGSGGLPGLQEKVVWLSVWVMRTGLPAHNTYYVS